jgi:hypothetical protein
MIGRNILMYFPWSRPDEEGAPLGNLDNRFGALFELRRLQWPKFEALADIERRFANGWTIRAIRCSIVPIMTLATSTAFPVMRYWRRRKWSSTTMEISDFQDNNALAALLGPCLVIWVFPFPIISAFDRRKCGTAPRPLSTLIRRRIDLISYRASALSISTRICRTSRCTATARKSWMFWWNSRSIWRRPHIHSSSKDGRLSTRCCNPNPTSLEVDYSYAMPRYGLPRTADWAASVSCGPT